MYNSLKKLTLLLAGLVGSGELDLGSSAFFGGTSVLLLWVVFEVETCDSDAASGPNLLRYLLMEFITHAWIVP